ncbi:MAG TPA: hypothetical protein VF593_14170 [Chthoniobacteraceae bacterium]|jgi:hypothetical protein
MKNATRRMKKVAPLVLLSLLLDHSPVNQSAQALVGGPFDDNNFPGINADGTYSATLSGRNLIGLVQFGVSSSFEGNGRFSVFHEGFLHYGAATGIADLASRRIAGSLLGVASLITADASGTAGSATATGSTQNLAVRTAAEGSFTAQMEGYPQAIKFEGEGRLSTTANTAVLVSSATGGSDFGITIEVPGAPGTNTDNLGAAGDADLVTATQSSILRTETPFKVRGSRTSRTLFSPINSYTGIPPVSVTTPTPTPVATAAPGGIPVIIF